MIRAVATWFIVRSIDRGRGLPPGVRAVVGRSASLRELERRLRATHEGLRASTPGLVGEPPGWLAPRTVSRLGARAGCGAGARGSGERVWRRAALVGGAAAVMAAGVFAAAVLLRAAPAPVREGRAEMAAGASGGDGDALPEESASGFVLAMLGSGERIASSDAISAPLRAEARRLRDDTQAAAGFLLDRLRIIGPVMEQ